MSGADGSVASRLRRLTYTPHVIQMAVRLVVEDSVPYRPASWHLWRDHRVFVPFATIQNWLEAGGKKARGHIDGTFLDWALEDFSGYMAVDELSERVYCVLSAVDNRRSTRRRYEVLDHVPTHEDIKAFLWHLKMALEARALALQGLPTEGSALSPGPMTTVFGAVPHQLCTFPVRAELVKGVLRAVAAECKRLAAAKPTLKRGRPASKDKQAHRAARTSKRMHQKIADVFQHRFLFVKRRLCPAERKHFVYITRGMPHLRTLREIMEHVYALYDRRCRRPTVRASWPNSVAGSNSSHGSGIACKRSSRPPWSKCGRFWTTSDYPPVQRGGTREPTPSQDAKERLPDSQQSLPSSSHRPGYDPRSSCRRATPNDAVFADARRGYT